MSGLAPGLLNFTPQLIIFDKDGTLIDFNAMWSVWIRELAVRIEHRLGRSLAGDLFQVVGFDDRTGRAIPGGPLAVAPMSEIRNLVTSLVRDALVRANPVCAICGAGQSGAPWGADQPAAMARAAQGDTTIGACQTSVTVGANQVDAITQAGKPAATSPATEAGAIMRDLWFVPDPTQAAPLADLPRIFATLCADGIAIAIATSDDYMPALATLKQLGVVDMVSALVAANEGIPTKPAPDMVAHLCANLHVEPASAVVVGDSVADMQMGHAAGAGACIGVASGVTARSDLADYATIVLPSIAALVA